MAVESMLVGSVPLDNAEAVFRTASSFLGPSARMLPDGETGPRSKFISWQEKVFAQVEQLGVTRLGPQSEWGKNGELPPHTIAVRPGAQGTPAIPRLGYAREALRSYSCFARLKAAGEIANTVKYQVCLPTPLGVLSAFGDANFQRLCEPAYRARMKEDLDDISHCLPHNEIVVQWDLPLEIAIWERRVGTYLPNPRPDVVVKLREMIEHLPAGVEQGLHLCYGDVSHQHWKEPDLALMVEFVNFVQGGLARAIDYIHLPVPRSWTCAEQFRPLRDLALAPSTRIFLGLLHATDGLAGARRRIEAAKTHLQSFGLAASCGLGRRDASAIPNILSLHRDAAELAT